MRNYLFPKILAGILLISLVLVSCCGCGPKKFENREMMADTSETSLPATQYVVKTDTLPDKAFLSMATNDTVWIDKTSPAWRRAGYLLSFDSSGYFTNPVNGYHTVANGPKEIIWPLDNPAVAAPNHGPWSRVELYMKSMNGAKTGNRSLWVTNSVGTVESLYVKEASGWTIPYKRTASDYRWGDTMNRAIVNLHCDAGDGQYFIHVLQDQGYRYPLKVTTRKLYDSRNRYRGTRTEIEYLQCPQYIPQLIGVSGTDMPGRP